MILKKFKRTSFQKTKAAMIGQLSVRLSAWPET